MKKSLASLFSDASEQDKRSANMIVTAIEKNALDGFDYIEYRASLDGLAKLDMDESTRYKSAFVTAATMGMTRSKLLKTAKFYRNIVVKEKDHFEKALDQQMTKGVAKLQSDIKKLHEAIRTKEEQIKKLQADIEKHKTKVGDIQTKIDSADEKIQSTQAGFERAYDTILQHIDSDISNIETYVTE